MDNVLSVLGYGVFTIAILGFIYIVSSKAYKDFSNKKSTKRVKRWRFR